MIHWPSHVGERKLICLCWVWSFTKNLTKNCANLRNVLNWLRYKHVKLYSCFKRFTLQGTNGVHMWLTRSKESLHGASMLSEINRLYIQPDYLSPLPAVEQRTYTGASGGKTRIGRVQPVCSSTSSSSSSSRICIKSRPDWKTSSIASNPLPVRAASMASLNLDRCLNIPDDYQGKDSLWPFW